jgi:hypothetical protein
MNTRELIDTVRVAWSAVPAPPRTEMKSMKRSSGEAAALAFTGVAPMNVDIRCSGFAAAEPLLDLPPRAAAAYLGIFLVSLLEGLEFQEKVGLFDDILTRAHTLTCLTNQNFWNDVIRKHLSPACKRAVERVALHLAANPAAMNLDQNRVDTLRELAIQSNT